MSDIEFKLTGKYIELYKLLKATGFCESGAAAKHAISESRVKVNGASEIRKAFKVRAGHRVEFEGQAIQVRSCE